MAAPHPIYMDYQATTPLLPEALDAMMPYLTERFGNPHSAAHRYGWEAEAALDIAREQVAGALGRPVGDVIFTSGATEANNLAVKGLWEGLGARRPKVVTLASEHSCVLRSVAHIAQLGADVTLLPVGADGRLDLNVLSDAMSDDVAFVSVMTVNNEIGTVQDMRAIAEIVHAHGALLHSDAAQALGKIDMVPIAQAADMISLSAHKTYGPKGVGALVANDRARRVLVAQQDGGGQEAKLRSGTQAPALVAGFGAAVQICEQDRAQEESRLSTLRDRFLTRLRAEVPDMCINGSMDHRWVGNLNIRFPVRDAGRLMADLPILAVSSGAACSSGDAAATSHVLAALGLSRAEAEASLRIGFGRMTDEAEVDAAADMLAEAVHRQKDQP